MKREREEDERDIIDISSDSGSDSASSDGEDELPGHQNSLFAEDESDDEDATMGGDSDDEGNYAAKEEEDLEDVVDDSAPRRSPSVAPAERGDVLVNLLNDRTPEETGPSFNALPLDIKYLLLGYLDTEPYSVYSLSMVSRSWYKALNQDSSTEVDWQRRCTALGAKRRSPHCKRWRETFIRQIMKRCLSCLRISDASFGQLLSGQPDWLTVLLRMPEDTRTLADYSRERSSTSQSTY